MKNTKIKAVAFKGICLIFFLFPMMGQGQDSVYMKTTPLKEKFATFRLFEVKPAGWIKEQLEQNLNGFTGHLDSLAPDLIVADDIYGKDRLTKHSKAKELGALGLEGDWQIQLYWWNSETQSNWWDGYIRSAMLTDDAKHLERVRQYIERILATQDADGYLGIYDPELRYKFENENGELWAKTTLLRGLLAWFDYAKDEKVLLAVKRAVDNTIKNFPAESAHPFYSKNPDVGGLSHGLTFTDVLEQLFYITGDQSYLDYALFLYKDFSKQVLNEDGQYAKITDDNYKFKGHGVHTYEQLRSLAAAWYASGSGDLGNAVIDFMRRLNLITTATGGPIGDEWIGGRSADATNTGYEYCSLQELLHSYASLYTKTGESEYGDRIERLFFNAAQGARNPEHSCIAYLKTDNSYAMTGGLNGDESDAKQTRYRYSPVHREAAVCCVPNAGRIAPYYVQHMWLKDGNDIVASLLGPSELNTVINGKQIKISERTEYPYENHVVFDVVAAGADFTLKIRIPDWAENFKLNTPYDCDRDYIYIKKKWGKREQIKLEFVTHPDEYRDWNKEVYFTYGALILAHPIESTATPVKDYHTAGLADIEYTPKSNDIYMIKSVEKIVKTGDLTFETILFNTHTNKNEKVTLKPIGKTILRQASFKRHYE
ncbi:MAG: hypothetical protein CFE23_08470 [Flavobacterium sp. BFFFF1]|uniref:beta-L-arabinofuranosidase domain-containing protein n=1 Tax=Flavobacterium sp. BFFFF1 TaxID=2015557 RepID=UPI000BDD0B1D|nr:beta-L-arabinofuranosidase domain-containing protein [Flavobacterium sp. BFFFF1]OYU80514.1 MAG: hypothetical protein CFE23_08470 [Flavobacterium sp. BFFFF1]